MVVVVGLTGGIGAGKSTFALLLAELGAEVIDVDQIGRAVIEPGTPGGETVLARFGTTERSALADIVFSDATARRALEAISWPLIEDELRERIRASQADVVVLDMAVLAQGLGRGIYGPVVTVEAPDETRVARLVQRGMSEANARSRMSAQTSEAERRSMADLVVVNDGSIEDLRERAVSVLESVGVRPSTA